MGNLNESIQSVRANEALSGVNYGGVMNKYSKRLKAIKESCSNKVSDSTLHTTAVLFENTNRYLNNYAASRGINLNESATQVGDVGFFKKFAINLLGSVVPNLIAEDIVSVQPMLSRVGEARYLRVLYGDNKGQVKNGDIMFSNFDLGQHPDQYTYTSEEVEGEEIDPTSTSVVLSWTPVIPGTIRGTYVSGATTVAIADDGNGNITKNGTAAGTIDYTTGVITFTTALGSGDCTLDYSYNNIDAPVQSPSIRTKVVSTPIVAKSRKLRAEYSFDALFDMSNDYGMSLNSEMVAYTAQQIKHEIDNEIISDLFKQGTAPAVTWSMTKSVGVSQADHYDSFRISLVQAGEAMFQSNKICKPNFYVMGELAATAIQSSKQGWVSSGIMDAKGPHLLGTINNIPVYRSPMLGSNEYMYGYKGSTLFDSGYIYAPYMPIMSTMYLMDDSFTGKQGFATSYGKKMCNPAFYGKGTIVNASEVLQVHENA